MDVLREYGVHGITTEDPGVWIESREKRQSTCNSDSNNSRVADGEATSPLKKIAAVGVHLRRFVSSYGVGLNVSEEPIWFLRQIVACGLEGKDATSLEGQGTSALGMQDVADKFVRAFVKRVNDGVCGKENDGDVIEGSYKISERDVLG